MCNLGKTNAQSNFLDTQPILCPLTQQREWKGARPEMRAVWLTTLGGLDWPHSYSQSAASAKKQQKELCDILDRYVEAGYNTVLFQARVRATTLYPSDTEPWAACLSGFSNKSPGYDALAFAIDECHKRGLKIHAWVVTIPVGKWNSVGCNNLKKTHPELLKKIGDEGFINPEKSGTAPYLANVCSDIVKRYDVDGIHLDYVRYPDTWGVIKDREKGRENITRIVQAIHDAVKAVRPWVAMSCSPVGKYADTKRMWSHGWNARDVVCQDAAKWLNDGLMDILFPMMYFHGDDFYPFAIDWQERSNGKIICPGLGIYFMDKAYKNWPLMDITQEMNVLRQYGMGNTFFRSKFFTDDTKGLYQYTKNIFSPLPAPQPAMWWYDSPTPQAPSDLSITPLQDGTVRLSWNGSISSQNYYNTDFQNDITYNIYGDGNLLAGNYKGTSVILPQNTLQDISITATDRYNKESNLVSFTSNSVDDSSKKVSFQGVNALPLLHYINGTLFLDNCDVTANQLIEIRSIMGNTQYLRITHKFENPAPSNAYGHIGIDITLPCGNYNVYLVNKKHHHHKLGIVSVQPTV